MVLNDSEFDSLLGGAESPTLIDQPSPVPEPEAAPAPGRPTLSDDDFDSALTGRPDANRVGLSMKYGQEIEPDRAAKVLDIQRKTGMPLDFVERNVDDLEKQVTQSQFRPDELAREYPKSASMIAEHPTKAALIRDDIELLKRIEDADRQHGFWRGVARSAGVGLMNIYQGIAKIPAQAYDIAAMPQNALFKAMGREDLLVESPEWARKNAFTEYYRQSAEAQQQLVPDLNKSVTEQALNGNFSGAARTFAMQLSQQAPQFLMMYMGGAAGLANQTAAGAGLMQAAETAERGREAGLDPFEAQIAAVTQGSAEALFERMGTMAIVERWGTALAQRTSKETALRIMADTGKVIAANAGQEGLEEAATSAVQSASDFASGINPNMTFTEALLRGADAFVLGAGMGGSAGSVGAIPGITYRTESYRAAVQDRNFYLALMDGVESSRARARLPEATREIVAKITENGAAENLYIAPEDIKEYFQSKNIDPDVGAAQLGIQVEYREALETGQDIKVKTADWAAKVAGTEDSKALAEVIKFSPDGVTPKQAREEDTKVQQLLEEADRNATAEAKESADEVKKVISEQLVAAGYTSADANANAELWRRTFLYFSSQDTKGRTPRQLLDQYGARIRRVNDTDVVIPPTQGFVSQQSATPLIARHNLTEGNLLHAISIGGLPVPSLAIAPLDFPMENFGEITLVAPSELIDPRSGQGARVFGADVYSPRYPSVEYSFTSAAEARLSKLVAEQEKVFGRGIDRDEIRREGPAALENNVVFMATFLAGKGVTPNIEMDTPNQEKLDELKKFGLDKYFGQTQYDLQIDAAFLTDANRFWESVLSDMPDLLESFRADPGRRIRQLAQDVAVVGEKVLNPSPDAYGSRNNLRDQIKELGLQNEFVMETQRVVKDVLKAKERIFVDYTEDGDRKYVGHTLKNVVRMMSKNIRGGEGFSYGAGSVRALVTPEFRSLSGIRAAKDRIVKPEVFADLKEEVNTELASLLSRLGSKTGRESFSSMNSAESALIESINSGDIEKSFADFGMQLTPDDIDSVQEFIDKLRNMPTEYFEALVTRAVGIDEFAAAVVPQTIGPIARKALEDSGVRLFEYDPNIEGSRQLAVEAAANSIPERVLFQRAINGVAAQYGQPSLTAAIERMANGLPDRVTPDQVRGYLRDLSVARRDQIGLDAFIGTKQSLQKADVLAFLRKRLAESPDDLSLFQSDISAVGFYSSVRRAVFGMDFKQVPAKDLANRIKNMQGIKKAELQAIGLIPYLEAYEGKITKDEVLKYLDDNVIEVTQTIYGSSPGQEIDGSSGADFSEITAGFDDDNAYESARENYRDSYTLRELRNELESDSKWLNDNEVLDEDGEIDEDKFESAMESEIERRIESDVRMYEENPDDYPYYFTFEMTENNSGRTFYRYGDDRWQDSDSGTYFSGDDNEAKIQITNWLISKGYIQGERIVPLTTDVTFAAEPTDRTDYSQGDVEDIGRSADFRERYVKAIIADGKTAEEAEQLAKDNVDAYPVDEDGSTPYQRDQAARELMRLETPPALREMGLGIGGPLLSGSILGNGGADEYRLEFTADNKKKKTIILGNAMSFEEAKVLAINALVDAGHLKRPPDPGDASRATFADKMTPTRSTKWGDFLVGQTYGREVREIVLRYEPKGDRQFDSVHFSEPNDVAHARGIVIEQRDGSKVFVVDEIQSDWNQRGRGFGYESDYKDKITEARAEQESNDREILRLQEILDTQREQLADEMDRAFSAAVASGELADSAVTRDTISDYRNSKMQSGEDEADLAARLVKDGLRDLQFVRLRQRVNLLRQRTETISTAISDVERKYLPDNPFMDTDAWASLVVRRAMRAAVELGVDKIAFAPGAVHAARWGSERVSWERNDDGTFTVEVSGQERGAAIEALLDGQTIDEAMAAHGRINRRSADKVETYEQFEEMVTSSFHDVIDKQGMWQAIKIAKRYWKMMQESPKGHDLRRAAGQMMFYDDVVAKKLVPKIVKELDKDAKPIRAKLDNLDNKERGDASNLDFTVVEITPKMRESYLAGASLFQGEQDGPRGRTVFLPDRQFQIDLFKNADRSTFLHESAHFFLEVMRDLATQENAPARIVSDFRAVLNQFQVAGPEDITREHHEQFAEMFENYLATSEAPTPGLRRLFAKFRVWLIDVYKSIKQIGTPVSDEIRGVFDSMLSAEDELIAKEGGSLYGGDAIERSMTPAEAESYRAARKEAEEAVRGRINRKVMQSEMKKRQRVFETARKAIEEEVTREVDARRDLRAYYLLAYGTKPDGSPLDPDVQPIKISKASIAKFLEQGYFKNMPKPYFYSAKGGFPAHLVYDMLGFNSVPEMLRELTQVPRRDVLIKEMVEARMRQEYGAEFFDGPPKIDDLMHEEPRERVLRMELEHLMEKNPSMVKRLIRRLAGRGRLTETISAKARAIIGRKSVGDVNPNAYLRAEQKARREAAAALTRGDIEQAFNFKQAELLNFQLYKHALEFEARVDKFDAVRKRMRRKDEDIAKSRDMNMVNAARAILAQYGLGQAEKSAAEYVQPIKQYDPLSVASVEALISSVATVPVEFNDAPVDQAVQMMDTVEAIWGLARSMRQMEIDGKIEQKEQIVAELVSGLEANASKSSISTNAASLTGMDRFKLELLSFKASLVRVEQWVDLMDGGDPNGPMRKYIWNPISNAVTNYRLKKKPVIERIHKALKTWAPNDMTEDIIAPELGGFIFRGKVDLLGLMLHLGNRSNKDKLVLGYGWGDKNAEGEVDYSRLNAFMQRMHNEGYIGKADWDLVQELWDTMENLKPDAQKANMSMFGFFFNEVTAETIVTPFGEYRGGYAPAVTDPNKVANIADKQMLEEMSNTFDIRALPTAGRGFTKSRVEGFAAPLLLDLRLVINSVDKVLKFIYIEPTARQVGRLVTDKKFEAELRKYDPTAASEILLPWLKRAVQQRVSQPSNTSLDKIAKIIRARTGLQTMFFNIANTLQQITGFSLTAVKVPPKYVAKGFARYMANPKGTAKLVAEKSGFMSTRMDDQVSQMNNEIDKVLINSSTFANFRDFVTRHGYFMQQFAQNIVDVSSWMAAYDQATVEGKSELDAIAYADGVVRTTQGSMAPEDIAAFEAGSPARRLFTMFVGYFNMQANLLGGEFLKAYHNNGLRPKYSRLFYVYLMGLAVPAFLSELIARGMAGELPDEDDEEQFITELVTMFFGSQARNVTGMVPYAGAAINTVFASATDTPMDDRLQTSPAIQAIEKAALSIGRMTDLIEDDGKSKRRAVKDSLSLFSLITGVPTGPIQRPAVYLIDVEEGRAQPESELDFARGIVTGRPGN